MPNWTTRWRALWNPDMYHGWGKTDRFFEGWYVKIVDPAERYVFALIPGISLGVDGRRHAFIQRLDGKKCQAGYHEFPVEAFQPSTKKFSIGLGANCFSADTLQLDLPELKGALSFSNIFAWPKMLGAPGIMGWYSFVPFMECYHGVVSMDHDISGSLEVYGEKVDFTGGKGYMEKDWGRSFPSCWIWTQTNHFDSGRRVSVMASVANIPWLGSYFVGFLVGFLLDDKLYRFATYTGAKMKAQLGAEEVFLEFKDRNDHLKIHARQGSGGELISPLSGNMTGKVNESMQSSVEVELYSRGQLIFSGKGRNAGLEVAGPIEILLTEKWRR